MRCGADVVRLVVALRCEPATAVERRKQPSFVLLRPSCCCSIRIAPISPHHCAAGNRTAISPVRCVCVCRALREHNTATQPNNSDN
ncbi:unnamed protein product [Toxocara canis]|uniref:Secreted protein n=1 Tax=Toxocara canis TaxID=6265 RepID=A0A183V1N4_TOXCA|nr:unnamed protein product [Toxocara canis]